MTEPKESITVTTRWHGNAAVVHLSGELDMHSSSVFTAEIARVLDRSPTTVGIDARDVTFVDSAGLRALLLAREGLEERRASLSLTHVSEQLERLLAMTGLREVLGVPVT